MKGLSQILWSHWAETQLYSNWVYSEVQHVNRKLHSVFYGIVCGCGELITLIIILTLTKFHSELMWTDVTWWKLTCSLTEFWRQRLQHNNVWQRKRVEQIYYVPLKYKWIAKWNANMFSFPEDEANGWHVFICACALTAASVCHTCACPTDNSRWQFRALYALIYLTLWC